MSRIPARRIGFADIAFRPRFAYGDECAIGETAGESFGGEIGTGFARMAKAWIPWTLKYDEVLTVFEGRLRVHVGDTVYELGPRDSLWLPDGTELIYEADDVLVHYAIHPATF